MQNETQNLQLNMAAKLISDKHQEALSYSGQTQAVAQMAIQSAHQCGQMLIKVRDSLEYGEWLYWLKANCPEIPKSTAYRYVELATKFPTVGNLDGCPSLRQAYILGGILPESESKGSKATSTTSTWLTPFSKLDDVITDEKLLKLDLIIVDQMETRLRELLKRIEESKAKRGAIAA